MYSLHHRTILIMSSLLKVESSFLIVSLSFSLSNSCWWTFNPVVPSGMTWWMDKLGTLISPLEVMQNGNLSNFSWYAHQSGLWLLIFVRKPASARNCGRGFLDLPRSQAHRTFMYLFYFFPALWAMHSSMREREKEEREDEEEEIHRADEIWRCVVSLVSLYSLISLSQVQFASLDAPVVSPGNPTPLPAPTMAPLTNVTGGMSFNLYNNAWWVVQIFISPHSHES